MTPSKIIEIVAKLNTTSKLSMYGIIMIIVIMVLYYLILNLFYVGIFGVIFLLALLLMRTVVQYINVKINK